MFELPPDLTAITDVIENYGRPFFLERVLFQFQF